jgi:Tol biopolymer transport system component
MRYVTFGASLALAVVTPSSAALAAGVTDPAATTSLVSLTDQGTQGSPTRDGSSASFGPGISAHGRYVLFGTVALGLVESDGDFNSLVVRDRFTGTDASAATNIDGSFINDNSFDQVMSADGRFVAYDSRATDVTPNDTNGTWDVFRKDMLTGVTTRVSIGLAGHPANGPSTNPAISADGTIVAFVSAASNLVYGHPARTLDVYVRNMRTGVTRLVSIGLGGHLANSVPQPQLAISADGRFVAWSSGASNLVTGDTNNLIDVFVRDLWLGVTRRVSVSTTNAQGNADSGFSANPAISADGRYVAFVSPASNLAPNDSNRVADVFVRDVVNGTTKRISLTSDGRQGNGDSSQVSMSADGRVVAFASAASNLVAGDTNGVYDIFVRDRDTGTTTRVSVGPGGRQANGASYGPAVSADGLHVAFESAASNLVDNDTNADYDVFVRDAPTDAG